MDRVYYVSRIVTDHSVNPPRSGALHFTTPDEAKARHEAGLDSARFLFGFADGALCEATANAPAFLRESATRKEAQRLGRI